MTLRTEKVGLFRSRLRADEYADSCRENPHYLDVEVIPSPDRLYRVEATINPLRGNGGGETKSGSGGRATALSANSRLRYLDSTERG